MGGVVAGGGWAGVSRRRRGRARRWGTAAVRVSARMRVAPRPWVASWDVTSAGAGAGCGWTDSRRAAGGRVAPGCGYGAACDTTGSRTRPAGGCVAPGADMAPRATRLSREPGPRAVVSYRGADMAPRATRPPDRSGRGVLRVATFPALTGKLATQRSDPPNRCAPAIVADRARYCEHDPPGAASRRMTANPVRRDRPTVPLRPRHTVFINNVPPRRFGVAGRPRHLESPRAGWASAGSGPRRPTLCELFTWAMDRSTRCGGKRARCASRGRVVQVGGEQIDPALGKRARWASRASCSRER